MTRISLEEAYNDKDVITQIAKLKDAVNEQAGGIIDTISITGNDLVIVWENGDTQTLPLPDPVTGISSVAGNVAGGNLTITFYFTNGTTHSFTTPLSGMASEDYVDTQNALNAKLAADNVFTGINTFTTKSPIVPDTPDSHGAVNDVYVNDATDGVNNLVHKTGTETVNGVKTFNSTSEFPNGLLTTAYYLKNINALDLDNPPANKDYAGVMSIRDKNANELGRLMFGMRSDTSTFLAIRLRNANGTWTAYEITGLTQL